MSHAPGPWKIDNHAEVFDKKGNGVCVPYTISDSDRANAKLIAAAPEMLNELEKIVERSQHTMLLLRRDVAPIVHLINKIKGVR